MNQEIELKFAVETKELLAALENRAGDIFPDAQVRQVHQTNYFYDTSDFSIRKCGIRIRLRKENERYVLTFKGPSEPTKETSGTKLTSRLEFEVELTADQAEVLLSNEHDPIWVAVHLNNLSASMIKTRDHLIELIKEVCTTKPLQFVGSFTNIRRVLPIEIDGRKMQLEFDETQLSNSLVQYEVELEIPSMELFAKSEAFLIDLFDKCGLTPGYARSKSERFFAQLMPD